MNKRHLFFLLFIIFLSCKDSSVPNGISYADRAVADAIKSHLNNGNSILAEQKAKDLLKSTNDVEVKKDMQNLIKKNLNALFKGILER